jgi:hypothetical protein
MIEAKLHDSDASVRHAVITTLGRLASRVAVIEVGLKDSDHSVCCAAVETLGALDVRLTSSLGDDIDISPGTADLHDISRSHLLAVVLQADALNIADLLTTLLLKSCEAGDHAATTHFATHVCLIAFNALGATLGIEYTSEEQHAALARALVEYASDDGCTLLIAAAGSGCVEVVRMLMRRSRERAVPREIESARLSDGTTAMHLAASHNHYDACAAILASSRIGEALLAAKDDAGRSPIDCCAADEKEHFELLRGFCRQGYGAFISYFKLEAQTEARQLSSVLEAGMNYKVFDSGGLTELAELRGHLHQSDMLVLMQTRSVLERPWCLLEILTAIDAEIPIVAVNCHGTAASYDFVDAQQLLSNLAEELDQRNPGATQLLEQHYEHGIASAQLKLQATVPSLISSRVDYSMSKRVLDAMLEDVVGEVKRLQGEPAPTGLREPSSKMQLAALAAASPSPPSAVSPAPLVQLTPSDCIVVGGINMDCKAEARAPTPTSAPARWRSRSTQ